MRFARNAEGTLGSKRETAILRHHVISDRVQLVLEMFLICVDHDIFLAHDAESATSSQPKAEDEDRTVSLCRTEASAGPGRGLLDILRRGGLAKHIWLFLDFRMPNAAKSRAQHPIAFASHELAGLAQDRCTFFTDQDLVDEIIGRWRMYESEVFKDSTDCEESGHLAQTTALLAPEMDAEKCGISQSRKDKTAKPKSKDQCMLSIITMASNKLGLDSQIAAAGQEMYSQACRLNFTKGRRKACVAGACIYLVCRQRLLPCMLADISRIVGVCPKSLGRVWIKLVHFLRSILPFVEENVVPAFAPPLRQISRGSSKRPLSSKVPSQSRGDVAAPKPAGTKKSLLGSDDNRLPSLSRFELGNGILAPRRELKRLRRFQDFKPAHEMGIDCGISLVDG